MSDSIKLCFLAAGRGKRMGDLVLRRPKALVLIRQGHSIFAINVRNLHRTGLPNSALAVGGHCWGALCEFADLVSTPEWSLGTVFNERFALNGPLHSVDVALREVGSAASRLAFINADTVYSTEVFARAILFEDPGVALIVSGEEAPNEDDVLVELDGRGAVARAAKRPGHQGAAAISAGFMIVNGVAAVASVRRAVRLAMNQERALERPLMWHTIVEILGESGSAVAPIQVPRCCWREFDSHACIERYGERFVGADVGLTEA